MVAKTLCILEVEALVDTLPDTVSEVETEKNLDTNVIKVTSVITFGHNCNKH